MTPMTPPKNKKTRKVGDNPQEDNAPENLFWTDQRARDPVVEGVSTWVAEEDTSRRRRLRIRELLSVAGAVEGLAFNCLAMDLLLSRATN
tara:strand:+ start:636 stop:905 length:270 start_codon:yes stop_codon:yes gene_type:complete